MTLKGPQIWRHRYYSGFINFLLSSGKPWGYLTEIMTADLNDPVALPAELDGFNLLPPSHIKTSDISGLARQLQASLIQNPDIFGGADIYNVRFQSTLMLAGVLTGVLIGLVDTDQRPAVNKFVVVVPPDWSLEFHDL